VHVRAVIDTNIWVSSFLNPFGVPAILRKAFEEGLFHAVISEPLFEKLSDVLERPRLREKYEIAEDDIQGLLALIGELADETAIGGEVDICRDADDNAVIETAVAGKATYLVTGDKDITDDENVLSFLSKHGVEATSLSDFLSVIEKT
jgi:uncharacterized protein